MWSARWIVLGVFACCLFQASLAHAELFPDAGPPGTTVTIGGGQFGDFVSTEVNRVLFSGTPALIQSWESDLVMVKVPLRAKSGLVTLIGQDGSISAGTFSVQTAKLTTLIPAEAEPGDMLVIEGAHFGNSAGSRDPNTMFGVNQVMINGVRAQVQKWRPNKIEVRIPANATSGEVTVRLASSDPLPDGSCCAPVKYATSNGLHLNLIPHVEFQPTEGPVGTKVVLSGQDFLVGKSPTDAVYFNDQLATVAEWGARTIVVHVPLNATSGPFVLNYGGRKRTLGQFHVVESHVDKVSPTHGPIGTLVRIQGEHFGVFSEGGSTAYAFDFDPGRNAVEFGGVPGIIHRWQDTEINVWVPFSAKSGPIVIKRGANIPHADGTCCAKQADVQLTAGSFTVVTPRVSSYSPKSAGLDELVTIQGSGFGSFIKISESTRLELHHEAHEWQTYELGSDVSRSEVLLNGTAAQVMAWTDSEIQVRVPRRQVFGFGTPRGFVTDLTEGEIVVRRGSWDILENGKCCTPKKWVNAVAGDFTILKRGLPDPDYFNIPNPRRD
ncbi:MAG: hypothetical protein GKS05_11365 [Nitrospirales bacterium]|nr:hypothetical protein [Nitrospirales bacterium]